MRCLPFYIQNLCILMIAIGLHSATAIGADPAEENVFLSLSDVDTLVNQYFSSLEKYQPGHIIDQRQVASVLEQLAKRGWEIENHNELLSATLSDSSFLIRKLRTKKGRQFMNRISNLPMGYDRLDRLSKMDRGHQLIHDLIYKLGGEEMIQYLTTSKGGKELGKQLSNAPTGKKFNKTTGKIFTETQLLEQLAKLHAEETKSREPNPEQRTAGSKQ